MCRHAVNHLKELDELAKGNLSLKFCYSKENMRDFEKLF